MRSIAESDLGTPKSPSTETVALMIDGVDIRVAAGTSVLRAASEAGITIPKLCATELLDAFGSCRLCLVQIEGMNQSAIGSYLFDKHRIFTTPIIHEEFTGIRITPNVYTTLGELDRFCNVMERIARNGLPA